ncbi:helix-turn-helix domain-containing protein [Aestuariivirga sp.]|jgi:excisionase family DNA binding protein|uniref:helix-turn-helix domain-containing protein n=1 Tax=Aestuariivirga sp. TaxID=2650926 RepID=UPI003782F903
MADIFPFAVSVAEAARMLNMGRTSTFAAIKRGELKARKIGRRTVVEVSEIRRYVENLPVRTPTKQAA